MSKIISGESADYSRWDLPDVDEPVDESTGRSVQELEALQQAAYEEGYKSGETAGRQAGEEAGYKAGYQEGLKAAKAEVAKLTQILDALAEPAEQFDADVEDQLVRMVLQVGQQVIRREIQTQPGEVMAVIRDAVAMLPMSAREIAVRLHPEDAALVRENWGDDEHAGGWKLVDDPSISRGGCTVHTSSSRIDATVEKRIAELCSQMLGGERLEDAETDAEDDGSES